MPAIELAAPPETPWQVYRDWLIEQSGDDGAYANWLESSGTLSNLAGLMACGTEFQSPWNAYQDYCAAFGVPPVMCEVGESMYVERVNDHWQTVNVPIPRWQAPSPALATAVLRAALHVKQWLCGMDNAVATLQGIQPRGMSDEDVVKSIEMTPETVRQHHPAAVAYRLKLGDGQWHERRL